MISDPQLRTKGYFLFTIIFLIQLILLTVKTGYQAFGTFHPFFVDYAASVMCFTVIKSKI